MSYSQRMWITGFGACLAGGVALIAWLPATPRSREAPPATPPIPAEPVSLARARPLPLRFSEMGYELLPLLRDGNIQRELKLSVEQRQAIQSLSEDYLTAAAAAHVAATAQSLPPSEVHQRVIALAAQYSEPATAVLTESQSRRLGEVLVQLRSIDLFRAPAMIEALGISAAQSLQIAEAQKRAAVVLTRLRNELTAKELDRAAYNDAVHAALVAAEGEVDAILTDAQREQMNEWRGVRIAFGRTHLRLAIHSAK